MGTGENDYRGQVLVVDDDPDSLKILERQLRHDFDVFTASNAEQGLAILARHPVDVAISDQRMPETSGVELLVEVSERYPDTTRILLSAYFDIQPLSDAVNQGHIFGYISKPCQTPQLRDMLRQGVEMARLRAKNRALLARTLEEELLRYQEMVANTGDLMALIDKDYRYLTVNRTHLELFQLREAEIIGRTVAEILGAEFFQNNAKPCIDHCFSGKKCNQQAWLTLPDERHRYFDVHYFPCVYQGALCDGKAMISMRDITKLKEAEKQAQQAEFLYRTLIEQSPDAVVLIDPETGRFKFFNDKLCELLGYSREETADLSIADYAALDPEVTARHIEKALREGEDCFETRFRTKQGEIKDVLVSVQVIEMFGSKLFHNVFQDITERKQFERELITARHQADAANHAKSAFLAGMSHELRTPLNGILGYAQILMHDPRLDEEFRNKIGTIQRSGEYLLTLINDVLDLSKIEAGKMELQPHEMHLRAMLDEVAQLFRIRAAQKNLRFQYECRRIPAESEFPTAVKADEKRLRQVLLNLLSNALKFTEQGRVTLQVTYLGAVLRVEVLDSGRGIAAADLAKIFKPFEQAGDQRIQEGTGLGLSICRKLVHMMGGELNVESTEGEGSRFWFDIPLQVLEWENAPPVRSPTVPRVSGYRGPRRTVLAVDDVAINRRVLADFLTPLGFNVLEAEDGGETLRKAAAFQPAVIFMDLRMPGMDGFETVRRLREMPQCAETPVFAVSASVFEEHRRRALTAGCTAFLPKPLAFEMLLKTLAEHCGIEWVDATAEQDPFCAELTSPPPEALEEVRKLARYGDVNQLVTTLESLIHTSPPEYAAYYRQALELAMAFELNRVCALLEGEPG